MGIQIKDLPASASPQRNSLLPGQLPTGETFALTYEQLLSLIRPSDLPFDPAGNPLTAELVQGAIEELVGRVAIDPTAVGRALASAVDKAAARSAIDAAGVSRGHLFGITLSNNATDTTNDIDFAAGEAASQDAQPTLMAHAAGTAQLDVGYGSGNGGRFDSVISDGTWHCFVISNGTAVSRGFSKSLNPTGQAFYPAGFTYFRRVGSIMRVSGAIRAFIQDGDQFLFKTAILDINAATPGTTAILRALSVPVGISVVWSGVVGVSGVIGASGGVRISNPDQTDQAASTTAAPLLEGYIYLPSNTPFAAFGKSCRTNTSGQIRTRMFSSSESLLISTDGWIDRRGKDL